jgi:hypothetical protein
MIPISGSLALELPEPSYSRREVHLQLRCESPGIVAPIYFAAWKRH